MNRRPTSVVLLAVLHLAMGICFLLCGIIAGGQIALKSALVNDPELKERFNPDTDVEPFLERETPFYWEIQYANAAFPLLMALAILAAGVGLLRLKPWSRTVSLFCAVACIVAMALNVYYTLAFLRPAMMKYAETLPAEVNVAKTSFDYLVYATIAACAVPFASAIVVIIVLCRRNVAAAFRKERAEPR